MGVTFQQIRNAAHAEAARVKVTQAEMIRTGDRAIPHADMLQMIEIWDKCALVMDIIIGDDTIKSRMLAALRTPGAGAAGASKP